MERKTNSNAIEWAGRGATDRRQDHFGLSGKSIFVGGPIQNAMRTGEFDPVLRGEILGLIELLRAEECSVLSAHLTEAFGEETPFFSPFDVAVRDFQWMKCCDLFIALLPRSTSSDELVRTDGTHVELGWASALDKPIVLIVDLPLSEQASHLLRGLGAVADVYQLDRAWLRDCPDRVIAGMVRALGRRGSS